MRSAESAEHMMHGLKFVGCACVFVMQPESWPVFVQFAREQHGVEFTDDDRAEFLAGYAGKDRP